MPVEVTTEPIALQDAAHQYLASLKQAVRTEAQSEILKFVRWCGPEREINAMKGHDVAQYAENLPPTVADAAKRADVVRAFLKWAKEKKYSAENLGTHLRVRKANKSSANAKRLEEQPVYLTKEGHGALIGEMAHAHAHAHAHARARARARARGFDQVGPRVRPLRSSLVRRRD